MAHGCEWLEVLQVLELGWMWDGGGVGGIGNGMDVRWWRCWRYWKWDGCEVVEVAEVWEVGWGYNYNVMISKRVAMKDRYDNNHYFVTLNSLPITYYKISKTFEKK